MTAYCRSLVRPTPVGVKRRDSFDSVRRGDGRASVLYVELNGFIHELALVSNKWVATALSQSLLAPKLKDVVGGAMGYVRADGITAVVYCGEDNHIHELTLVDDHWVHSDLSRATGITADGHPFAFVRSDGVSSLVYRGSDAHIHEFALPPA